MLRSGVIIAVLSTISAFYALETTNPKVIYETAEANEKEKIVGGSSTYISRHPYQAIVTNGRYLCGGTILTETHILTAGHCVSKARGNFVVTGTSKVAYRPAILVKEIWLHPLYNETIVSYDVAVLKLATPIEFDKFKQPATLPTKNVVADAVVNVTGFGAQNNGVRVPSRQLKVFSMRVRKHAYCKYLLRSRFSDHQMCIMSPYGTGVCVGDSGGPLSIGNTVVGVVSFTLGGCANGLPQVFTDVYKLLPFIREAIKRSSD